MPLRPIITASCPADRGTQQPLSLFLSIYPPPPPPPEIRPGCTEAKPAAAAAAVTLHALERRGHHDSNFFKVRAAPGLITVTVQLLCTRKIAIFLITT